MIHWLIQYALLSFGLAAALALFLSLKRELRRHAQRNRKNIEELAEKVTRQESYRPAEPVYLPAAPRSGLNISKRVQAMRMLRRNQDTAHIAAVLGVTRREVELLIRVQNLGAQAIKAASN